MSSEIFDLFDPCLDGIAVISEDGQVRYVNEAFATMTEITTRRWLKNQKFFNVFQVNEIETLHGGNLSEVDSTAYFETGVKVEGGRADFTAQLALKRVPNEKLWVLYVRDISLEDTLHKKYKSELSKKEDTIKKLDRTVLEVSTLFEISQALLQINSIDEVCSLILKKIGDLTNFENALLLLPDEKAGLEARIKKVNNEISLLENKSVPNWMGEWLESKSSKTLAFVNRDNLNFDQWLASQGIDDYFSGLVIPLNLRNSNPGFILLLSRTMKISLEDSLKGVLTTIGAQMATAVESQRFFENSIRDPMTGLYNNRYFNSIVPHEIDRCKRLGYGIGVTIVDVDFFKKFNDTYGHQTGDEVLKHVANTLKVAARKSDIAVRYGGEEFVVLHVNIDREGILKAAERIRQAIQTSKLQFEGKDFQVTASLGSTLYVLNEDFKETFSRADDALYKSKQDGRNRCTLGE